MPPKMKHFNGDDDYAVDMFIKEFEDVAALMQWSEIEKLIYSKGLLEGTAKLFLRTLRSIRSWDKLKEELIEEFGQKLDSAAINKMLTSVKKECPPTTKTTTTTTNPETFKDIRNGDYTDDNDIRNGDYTDDNDISNDDYTDDDDDDIRYDDYNDDNIRFKEEINTLIEEYDPKRCDKESNVILLIDETPLEEDDLDKQINEEIDQKIISPIVFVKKNYCSDLTTTLEENDLLPRDGRYSMIFEENDYAMKQQSDTQMKHDDTLSRQRIKNICVLTDAAARLQRAKENDLKIKLLKRLLDEEPYEDYIDKRGIPWKMIKYGRKLMIKVKKKANENIKIIQEESRRNYKRRRKKANATGNVDMSSGAYDCAGRPCGNGNLIRTSFILLCK